MARRLIPALVALALALAPGALARPAKHNDLLSLLPQVESRNGGQQDEEPARCGYAACPAMDPTKTNVHIIAHTHDDVGWLKTVDQYYYGTRKRFDMVGVQHILDSVIPQLLMDRSKRFIYVEMSFFTKWWNEQDETMKRFVRQLVQEGRFEFINGGWCMNDEATVTYSSTIEQMTLGLKFLNETFGACARPKVGWQIDPFGHTSEQASLFAQFGFDGMYFTRISHEDKASRIANKTLDLMWRADQALDGQSGSIFTNVFKDSYNSPDGYCFDVSCKDDNLVDNKKSYEYNMDKKGQDFIQMLRDYARAKMTNHVLMPFGGDFHFSAASQNFKNIDKLIKYVRSTAPDINIFYSTPTCYQFAVNQVVNNQRLPLKLPEKFDDFMPYDSSPGVWWSGYFSSRPSVKLIERQVSNLLMVSRMVSLANLIKHPSNRKWVDEVRDHEARCLMPLWEVHGDLQHHDAVTGTEKQHVTNDYVRRSNDALSLCAEFIGEHRRNRINDYLRKSPRYDQLKDSGKKFHLDPVYLEKTSLCTLLNISQCEPVESEVELSPYASMLNISTRGRTSQLHDLPPELATKASLINVYNSLARPISKYDIRIPCNGRCDLDKIKVIHLATNDTMKLARLPVPSGVVSLPFRNSLTKYEILFYANIPALGYTSFILEDLNGEELVEEEAEDAFVVNDNEPSSRNVMRGRRIKREAGFDYFTMAAEPEHSRHKRASDENQQDRVIVKFDLSSGLIVGLKRASDGSFLNITQKFGYYSPAQGGHPPGAYIFRPNSTDPTMFDKPIVYKMYKRKNGALIEIHQKWSDWIWQTIRVDAKKNYIEFDYVVGPIPTDFGYTGKEVVTRYMSNMVTNGVFLTDSSERRLMVRQRIKNPTPNDIGGSFYPVVSTIMLKNTEAMSESSKAKKSAEAIAIQTDRTQAGTSLHDGQLELLVHRRQMEDDDFGVSEALNEPGEDGRGLVTRGSHRLYLKFYSQPDAPDSADKHAKSIKFVRGPSANLQEVVNSANLTKLYMIYDRMFDDLNIESRKHSLKPVLTFDRLRIPANEFKEMIMSDKTATVKTDLTLLNTSLPDNVHLLTLQPWTSGQNELLLRFENLDNPLILYPSRLSKTNQILFRSYEDTADTVELYQNSALGGSCQSSGLVAIANINIEYLIRKIRIVSLDELNLGANNRLADDKRLFWSQDEVETKRCDPNPKPTSIKLAPRQIRTFLARFETIS